MLFTLLGTITLGVAAAGTAMILFRLIGRKAPRWTLPVVAGAAMLGFQIWTDYSWFGRTAEALPPHMSVAGAYGRSSAFQPWTLLVTPVDRFAVVDTSTIRRNERVPGVRMVQIHLVGRYMPTVSVSQLYDCDMPRRADLAAVPTFDADGRVTDAQWVALEADDPMRNVVCAASL